MKNKINDTARLNHIIDAILEIEEYVANESYVNCKFEKFTHRSFRINKL